MVHTNGLTHALHSLSHTDSLTSNPGSLSFPPLSSRAYDSQQLGILPSGRTTPFLEFFRVSGSPSFPQLTVYHDTLTTRYLHLHLYIRIFSTINTNQQTCLNATLVDNGVIRVEILWTNKLTYICHAERASNNRIPFPMILQCQILFNHKQLVTILVIQKRKQTKTLCFV